MNAFITIDTDNAIIRIHIGRMHGAGLTDAAVGRLITDIRTLAEAIKYVTKLDFKVAAVD